jgi:hypothetical protein
LCVGLSGKEIAGQLHGIGFRRAAGCEVDVARTLEQRAAMAVGIVNALDRTLDSRHGVRH